MSRSNAAGAPASASATSLPAALFEQAKRRPDAIALREKDSQTCFLPIAPLMHGATQWSVMSGAFVGRKNVLVSKFDPADCWRLVEEEKVNGIMITGDAMGRPLVGQYSRACSPQSPGRSNAAS